MDFSNEHGNMGTGIGMEILYYQIEGGIAIEYVLVGTEYTSPGSMHRKNVSKLSKHSLCSQGSYTILIRLKKQTYLNTVRSTRMKGENNEGKTTNTYSLARFLN